MIDVLKTITPWLALITPVKIFLAYQYGLARGKQRAHEEIVQDLLADD